MGLGKKIFVPSGVVSFLPDAWSTSGEAPGEARLLSRALITGMLCLLAVGTYVAAPLVAAFEIRQAIRQGDTETLARKVDWVSVRHSLKLSMRGRQPPESGRKPGLMRRATASALPYLTEPLIDRYVTPEGVLQLYAWRRSIRKDGVTPAQSGAGDPASIAVAVVPDRLERNLALLRRIERWSFPSLTRLELDMAERRDTGRRWRLAMEMHNLKWRLTEVVLLPERIVPAQNS